MVAGCRALGQQASRGADSVCRRKSLTRVHEGAYGCAPSWDCISRPGMLMPMPHLTCRRWALTCSTSESRLTFFPSAVLLTPIACPQRCPHLGTIRGAFSRPGLTLDSRPFCLAEAPNVVDRSVSSGSIFLLLDTPERALTPTMDQSERPGPGRESSSLRP